MFTRWFHNLSKNAALLLALTPLCLLRASSMPSVLGYDYGFYRYAALHPSLSLNAIFTGVQGGYANILFPLLHALRVPVDVGLIACLYLAAIALGATLCYILLPYSKTAAICGVLLLACSTIQSETYNMFLWKTVLALPLLLMGLLGLEKKKYILLGGALLALILTHRTTLIVLLLAVGLHIFIRLITTRRWHYVLYVGLGLGLLALTLGDSLGAWWHIVFSSANGDVVAGIFFHNQNVLVALLPISLLALYGLSTMVKQKSTPATLLLFVGISLGWIFLRLPFYHRFYIYLDLGLLLLGAIGLVTLWQNNKNFWLRAVIVIGLILLFLQNIQHIRDTPILISQAEIQEISSFATPLPAPFVLATSAEDAPWLLGYLERSRLAAPGLFEDTHPETTWRQFWRGEAQQLFLSSFPQPLYLYDRSFKLSGRIHDCLTKVSENFSKFTCN